MLTYAFKRILLMIPTFIAISFLIFVLLNFAGNPAAQMQSADGNEDANSASKQESYRLFKEQFNLDKPIIWNSRYNLKAQDIEESLRVSLNLDESTPPAEQIEAKEKLENWGRYAVPGLIETLENSDNDQIRTAASKRLSYNAKKRLLGQTSKKGTREQRSVNAFIAAQNKALDQNNQAADTVDKSESLKAISANWKRWWAEEWAVGANWLISDEQINKWVGSTADINAESCNEMCGKMNLEGRIGLISSVKECSYGGVNDFGHHKLACSYQMAPREGEWSYSASEKLSITLFDTRFAKYWQNLVRLDFGISSKDKRPVLETVISKLKYSITLAVSSVFLIYLISLPLGIWSAVRQNTTADRLVTVVLFMLYSLPSFFTGVVLLNLFTVGDAPVLQPHLVTPEMETGSGAYLAILGLVLIGTTVMLTSFALSREKGTAKTPYGKWTKYSGLATLGLILLAALIDPSNLGSWDAFIVFGRNAILMGAAFFIAYGGFNLIRTIQASFHWTHGAMVLILTGLILGFALNTQVSGSWLDAFKILPLIGIVSALFISKRIKWSGAFAKRQSENISKFVKGFIGYGVLGAMLFSLMVIMDNGIMKIFPNSGFSSLETDGMTTLDTMQDVFFHVILPITCMSYGGLAALSRYARTGMLDIIRADFIRTARAKGLPEGVVIIKHAARNGMIPIITLMATLLPALIGGSVIIEVIFGIPGMGEYIFSSIMARDYNPVMAVLLISSTLTLIGMLLSDLAYALVDPRITFD